MSKHYLHMYVPAPLLPVLVFLTGRRQCCGERRTAPHLACCRRRPWTRVAAEPRATSAAPR